jgi:hypothetical protein
LIDSPTLRPRLKELACDPHNCINENQCQVKIM